MPVAAIAASRSIFAVWSGTLTSLNAMTSGFQSGDLGAYRRMSVAPPLMVLLEVERHNSELQSASLGSST
jgi:hypothetical protein